MSSFDKINNSMIVSAFRQVSNRRHREIFSQMSRTVVQSTNMCFTVRGSPQDWQVGGSSPDNKYESYRQQWPIHSL